MTKLLVFDLNNLLIYREKKYKKDFIENDNIFWVNGFKIWIRGGKKNLIKFMKRCSQKYQIAIWSSMLPKNCYPIVNHLFHNNKFSSQGGGDWLFPIQFIWTQTMCKQAKPQNRCPGIYVTFLKNIQKIGEVFPHYNEEDILILDDNSDKMRNNKKENFIITERWTSNNENNLDELVYLLNV